MPLRLLAPVAAIAAVALAGAPMAAWAAGRPLAIDLAGLKGGATLAVSLPGVAPGGALPLGYTAYGRNTSPPLSWSAGPPGVRSYAVVLQDPDAPLAEPFVHWLVWNLAPEVASLPKAMRNIDRPATPLGAVQGANSHGGVGYSGPRPPPGDAPHHYHFQVFALDRTLRLRPGSDLAAVLAAMPGHVLASGELIALFAAPPPRAARPTPAAPAPGPG